MNRNTHTYTILVIPERNGERTISIRLSKTVIIMLLTLFCILAMAAGLLMYKSAEAAKKLHYFYALRNNNEMLIKENSQLRLIYKKIGRIDTIASYLEGLSEVSSTREKSKAQTMTSESKLHVTIIDTVKTVSGIRNPMEKKKEWVSNDKSAEINKTADLNGESLPTILPAEGWITQQFNDDTTQGGTAHPGIDIAAAEGMIIKAPAPGTVFNVGEDQYYGNLIVIKHDNGFITRYGHCAKILVLKNEKVERGQTIALVGNTGHSSAPHLHYEVIRNGKNMNPMEYISSGKK